MVGAGSLLTVSAGAAAFGAELVTAEVTGTQNDVTVTQGQSTQFTINLDADGAVSSSITLANPSTAKVKTDYSLNSLGVLSTGSSYSSAVKFYSSNDCNNGGNCDVTGSGSAAATISADTATPVGDYTIILSSAAGTTVITNPSGATAKLNDASATQISVHVVAAAVTDTDMDGVPDATDNCPSVANASQADADGDGVGNACDANAYAPTVLTPADDANGDEGDQLTTSGAFADQDTQSIITITKTAGEGDVTDHGNGTWSWSLGTSDDTSGTVTVQASDGEHTATDSFDYSAANVAPTTPGKPMITTGANPNKTGGFTLGWTASTDVSGDSVTYTLQHRDTDDADWSTVATALTSNSYAFGGSNPAEAEGSWSYRVQATDGETNGDSDWSDTSDAVVVDKQAPTAPGVSADRDPDYTDGDGHKWYADSVTVSATAGTDPALLDTSAGSGVDTASLPSAATYSDQSNPHTFTATEKDNAGNESVSNSLTVYVDTAAPVVTLDCSEIPATVHVGDVVSVPWTASDTGGSGVKGATSGSVNLDTSSVDASRSISVAAGAAEDHVGKTSAESAACNYSVVYNWTGFYQPIDVLNGDASVNTISSSTIWNSAKAGSAIPVKFSLHGDQGLSIFGTGSPKSVKVACPSTTATVDAIESVAGTTSGLKYDALADQYNYTWKTSTSLSGTCQRLEVGLVDGSTHYAFFKFTK